MSKPGASFGCFAASVFSSELFGVVLVMRLRWKVSVSGRSMDIREWAASGYSNIIKGVSLCITRLITDPGDEKGR